jgi:hypothetical protein
MQASKVGTRSMWETWRWGEGLTPPAETKSRQVKQSMHFYSKCANFSTPRSDQFDEALANETVYNLIAMADNIYYLCVECERKFPKSWEGKLSVLNGLEVDKCLGHTMHGHLDKVTDAHKLIVRAAKDQGFHKAMVLEQDIVVNEKSNMLDEEALANFIDNGEWKLLRFGHYYCLNCKQCENHKKGCPRLDQIGRCSEKCLCGRESLSRDVCTIASGCDMRSSHAYMVKSTLPDDFFEIDGIIDLQVMSSFKQSFIVPALLYQGDFHYRFQLDAEAKYQAHCMAGNDS